MRFTKYAPRLACLSLLTALSGGWPSLLDAAPVLVLNQGLAGKPLGTHAAVFLDPTRELGIDDIRSRALPWVDWAKDSINLGLSPASVWIRLDVENRAGEDRVWYLDMGEALIRDIRLYWYEPDGRLEQRVSGFGHGFDTRDVAIGVPVFRLAVPAHAGQRYWLHLAAATTAHRLSPRGWNDDELAPALNRLGMIHGIWYGTLLIMSIYNLILARALRERTYGWFALYLAMAVLAQASYSGKFVPVLSGLANPDRVLALNFAVFALMALAGMEMTRHFLDLPCRSPRQDALCRGVSRAYGLIVGILLIPQMPVDWIGPLISLVSVPTNLLVCLVTVDAWMKGYRPARFFVVGWLGVTLATLIFALRNLALIDINRFTVLAYPVGILLSLVLFSMALADRIRTWQKERDTAQAALLEERHAVERVLAQRVAERTESLYIEKQRADAANQLKDRFVALVAHDLRSPLSSLKQVLARLNAPVSPIPDGEREVMHRMHDTVTGLLRLIDRLLDLDRLKTGRFLLQLRPFDARTLVGEQITRLAGCARERAISLHNAVPVGYYLRGDEILMGEVVANLLDNAIKFCRSGDSVFIRPLAGDSPGLEVADNGPGLPRDWTHSPSALSLKLRHLPGAGIDGMGLVCCEAIMVAHGGGLSAETAPEGGACFRLWLPVARPTGLLVGDLPSLSTELRHCLHETWPEWEVVRCDDAGQALAYLATGQPALIIVDQVLPDRPGLELIGQLRQQTPLDPVPMLLMTALAPEDGAWPMLAGQSARIGADALLQKPVTAAAWQTVLEALREGYPACLAGALDPPAGDCAAPVQPAQGTG